MNEHDPFRIQKIQQRIDSALRESPKDRRESRFSPYIAESKPDLENQLMSAASSEGLDGVEAALDEFDRLAAKEDGGRLRHALMIFLTHDSRVDKIGLRIPTLEERSPWKLAPSNKRSKDDNNDSLRQNMMEQE